MQAHFDPNCFAAVSLAAGKVTPRRPKRGHGGDG
jgi:hypothetical protein